MLKENLKLRRVLRVFGGLAIALIVCLIDWGLDWPLYDFLFKMKGGSKPNSEIVLVSVDDKTLSELKKVWPVPIPSYTKMLDIICKEKPSVIGFDIEFTYHMGKPAEYERLAKVLKKNKCRVLWGRSFVPDESNLVEIPKELPYQDISVFNGFKLDGNSPQTYMRYARRVTPYFDNGKEVLKSLAFASVEMHLNKNLVEDPKRWYEFLTDYAGPAGTYKTVSMVDILNKKFEPEYFKDKIVFVGRGEGEFYTNFVRTPYFSGKKADTLRIEVHANIADTVLKGKQINKVYPGDNKTKVEKAHNIYAVVATFILCVFTVWVLFGTTPLMGILIVLIQVFVLLVIGLISLKTRSYVSMIFPLLGVFIGYYLLVPYRLVNEYRRRWEFEQANKILSEVERMKSNFLSLITHDLKTPIARIQGLAESLLMGQGSKFEDMQKKPLKAIIKNSEELNDFITRILSLSRIETSEVKLNLTSRDLNALAEETVDKFKYMLKDKNIELEKDLEPLFSIKMDDQLIGQVIYNLMDNAVKYSDPGTKIKIKSWEEDQNVNLSVTDNGIGIGKEDLKNMFTKFYRVKDKRKEDVKGSGLGLYLVKYFIELHGGSIKVESKLNEGTTFTFTLPVK